MNKYKLILPIYGVVSVKKKGVSLSMNWYRNAHYQSSATAKKRFKKLIMPQLIELDILKGKLRIDYVYYAKRKGSDLDNFIGCAKKFLQDSLTECGLIVDDNCSVIVKNTEVYAGIDNENPRIEAFITELD